MDIGNKRTFFRHIFGHKWMMPLWTNYDRYQLNSFWRLLIQNHLPHEHQNARIPTFHIYQGKNLETPLYNSMKSLNIHFLQIESIWSQSFCTCALLTISWSLIELECMFRFNVIKYSFRTHHCTFRGIFLQLSFQFLLCSRELRSFCQFRSRIILKIWVKISTNIELVYFMKKIFRTDF